MNELPKLLPVSILITSFNRVNLLKKCIQLINDRTFYPFRIIVIDNNSTDGSQDYLRHAKTVGKIFDAIFLPENIGQSKALNRGFFEVEKWENELRRPSLDFIITNNEDIYPSMLGQQSCWLTQMIDILERHEPEFGGICMRIQRLARTDIDESKEIIECYKGFNSIFRLMRRSDLRQLGSEPFGRLLKWNSNSTADKYKLQLKKKFGFCTHIYADHAGFMEENRGYEKGFTDYFTYAENKVNMATEKPYPDINSLTNEPIKINHPCDAVEQELRDDYKKIQSGEIKKEVTLIVLTYKRPNGLKRLIDSIRKYTTNILYDILVVIDNDDTESYQWCIKNNIDCILTSYHGDFVRNANMAAYTCQTHFMVILADDMEVIQDNWLLDALKIFKERFTDSIGLMAFNDTIQAGRLFATGMTSKKFIYAMGGHLYDPRFRHFGGDNVTSTIAKQLGFYHYAESIKVNHYHPTNKNPELVNPNDETYRISQQFMHDDQKLKKERKSDLNKLIQEKNYHDFSL